MKYSRILQAGHILLMIAVLSACAPQVDNQQKELAETSEAELTLQAEVELTLQPTRPVYQPGELVEYTVQTGDTLDALAAHFNTTVDEIRKENNVLPETTSTLPPGLPLKIPIYYQALWGSSYQIMPDCLFPNGPAQSDFDVIQFVEDQPGWFKNYTAYTGSKTRQGGELIDYLVTNFSVSPRVLLAIIEYQTDALSTPVPIDEEENPYPLGFEDDLHVGLYNQLLLAANLLNNGYYGWRTGNLGEFELANGTLIVPDPWQNAATIALQYYYGFVLDGEAFQIATHGPGFVQTYNDLFGEVWTACEAHIPGSLSQPAFILPFEDDKPWAYTGGPHTGWGLGEPFAAIDFAPPNTEGGCKPTDLYATALADGVIARKGIATAALDLDGDGNEQTGWVVFYLHLATDSIPPVGTYLQQGDRIGLPSCEGGRSTGTHVHIARKYNGEWIPADSALPFNLDGWVAINGNKDYQGFLKRFGTTITASVSGDVTSQIHREIEKNSP
ncbi:MAG: LysM peptidoglycan-binding domain-containing protein [Anaerolineaceae bacterium]|nr:LysM peptidoglycan-binding domain-containing protein [Anaerolineaceae bacterium]